MPRVAQRDKDLQTPDVKQIQRFSIAPPLAAFALQFRQLRRDLAQLGNGPPGAGQDAFAEIRQQHAVGVALKQRHIEKLFQVTDSPRDRRLGAVKFIRRTGYAPLIDHLTKCPYLHQVTQHLSFRHPLLPSGFFA